MTRVERFLNHFYDLVWDFIKNDDRLAKSILEEAGIDTDKMDKETAEFISKLKANRNA